MQPDRMDRHVNVSGLAVFELIISKSGRVLNAKAVTLPPLASPLLTGSNNKWRFRPLMRDGVARQSCGRLVLRVSIAENQSEVETVQ